MGMAPAPRKRATSVASAAAGGAPARPSVPAVETFPATSIESLTLKGTPCRGPVDWPQANAWSAVRAASMASSASTSTAAWIAGFTVQIRSR